MTTLKPGDKMPQWKGQSAWGRVVSSRIMLYQHGFISESERRRIDNRINAWHAKHASASALGQAGGQGPSPSDSEIGDALPKGTRAVPGTQETR